MHWAGRRVTLARPTIGARVHWVRCCLRAIAWLVLISATAGALNVLRGQDAAPREYENLQVLAGASRDELEQIMEAMRASLGVGCEYCHVSGDPASDAKPAKEIARDMVRMLSSAATTHFQLLELPSCWTCHRGSPIPETAPVGDLGSQEAEVFRSAFSNVQRPAGEIYGNIQNYDSLPARELQSVMGAYSEALGVGCDHCHLQGEWDSDAPLMKLMSRRMFEIQEELEASYLGPDAITCWTCHRGETLPQTRLPSDSPASQP